MDQETLFFCEFCIRHDFYVYVISSDGNDEIFNETFVFKFSIKYSDSLRLRINQQFSQNLCDIQFIHELLSETQFSPFYQSFLCAVLRNARQSFRYHFLFFWLYTLPGNLPYHQSHFVINFILLWLLIMQMFVLYERKKKNQVSRS